MSVGKTLPAIVTFRLLLSVPSRHISTFLLVVFVVDVLNEYFFDEFKPECMQVDVLRCIDSVQRSDKLDGIVWAGRRSFLLVHEHGGDA